MKSLAVILSAVLAVAAVGGTLNLTNDTVYVGTPATDNEAATKAYADTAIQTATQSVTTAYQVADAAHTNAADPHPQYATDTALATHTGLTGTAAHGLGTMSLVNDAPSNGTAYARQDNGWVVSAGAGDLTSVTSTTPAYVYITGGESCDVGVGVSNVASAAQGALADTALQPANTSGWVVASHSDATWTNAVRAAQTNDGTGTDDQTLAEVLAQGATADRDINMGGNWITNSAGIYGTGVSWVSSPSGWLAGADGAATVYATFSGNGAGLTNLNLAPYAGTNLTWTGGQLHASGGGASVWTDDGDGTYSIATTNATGPSLMISNPASMTANTDVLQIKRGGTELLALDEDGDFRVGGGIYGHGYVYPYSAYPNVWLQTANATMLKINVPSGAITMDNNGFRYPYFDADVDFVLHCGAYNALVVDGSTGNGYVGIGMASPVTRLHVNGAIALDDMTTPTAYTNVAQFFATNAASAEMWVMDGAGNATQLSSHNAARDHIARSYNVYSGEGREINLDALALAVQAIADASPQARKALADAGYDTGDLYRATEHTPVDWDAEQAARVAARDAEIAAWMSDTNAPEIKGERPTALKPIPRHEWARPRRIGR